MKRAIAKVKAESKPPVWSPDLRNVPQMQGYACDANEILTAGGSFGGKTDLLLGMAMTKHRRSIIFRRESTQLKPLIERAQEILGPTDAIYHKVDKHWRDIPGERTLQFASMQYEDDKEDYQGASQDLKGFDELTHFTESQYMFVTGWLRTTKENQRTQMMSTCNPPKPGRGDWVLRRWAAWLNPLHPEPANSGEIRWFVNIPNREARTVQEMEVADGTPFQHEGETLYPKSRTAILSTFRDNIYTKPEYEATLQSLPEPDRSRLLYGDFTAGHEDDAYQVIPTEWVFKAIDRWKQRERPDTPMTAVGVDPARGGEDTTNYAPRYGNWYDELIQQPGSATPDGFIIATEVKRIRQGHGVVNIDSIGIGAAPFDILRSQDIPIQAINASESTDERDRTDQFGFINVRAKLWWKFREALDPEFGEDIALPDDREMVADLCSAKWEETVRGIKIIHKDKVKQTLGRSPGKGEAVIMAATLTAPVVMPSMTSQSWSVDELEGMLYDR